MNRFEPLRADGNDARSGLTVAGDPGCGWRELCKFCVWFLQLQAQPLPRIYD